MPDPIDPLEQLVRPFQEQAPSRDITKPWQKKVPNVNLQIGRGQGSERTLGQSTSMSMSFYCHQYENEKRESSSG